MLPYRNNILNMSNGPGGRLLRNNPNKGGPRTAKALPGGLVLGGVFRSRGRVLPRVSIQNAGGPLSTLFNSSVVDLTLVPF